MKLPNGTIKRWLDTVAMKWESDECLMFPFDAIGSHGYGQVGTADGKGRLAHRYICTLVNGEPPKGRNDAAHSCGKKLCVNKRHLRWASRKENESDKYGHGTRLIGEDHARAKLTTKEVLAIRAAEGPQPKIAARFGITQQTVSDIKLKKRWAWL